MSLKNNVLANYFGQGWTALMGLAFIPLYIRYLGVEAWGLVAFMSMLQAWLTLLDLGLTPTLSREMARFQAGEHSTQSIRDLLRSLELIFGGVAVAVASIVWLLAPWVASQWFTAARLPLGTVSQAVASMGLVLAARMLEQVYRGAVQGLQRQVWLNGAQAIVATVRWAGAVVVLMYLANSIEAFFVWQGVVSVLSVILMARQTYLWLPRSARSGRFDRAALVRIRPFAAGVAATTLLVLLLTQVDKLLLSKLVPLEEFGYYALAASVSGALYFLISPVATAASPRMAELVSQGQVQLIIDTYHGASQWLAAILIPAALVMASFAQPLLLTWTGNLGLALRAAPLLSLLALGTLCNGLMNVPYLTQLAYGWSGFAARVNMVAVCLIVPAILWSVPRFGAIGAAWAWLALNAGYVLVSIHFMHVRLLRGEKRRWFRDAVIQPLGVGAVIVLTLRGLIELPHERIAAAATLIGITVFVTGVVFLSMPIPRARLCRRWQSSRG